MKKNRIAIFSLLLLIACLFTACGSNEDSKSAEILSKQSVVSDEIISSKEESKASLESNESEAETSAEASEEAHTHSFGEWVTSKNATCVEEGTKERLCSCGEKETETIEATGHIEGEWITDAEATCIKEGSKHLVCANCSESLKTETIQATGKHNYTSKVTTAATCVEEGVKTFTCSMCKDSYQESIDAGHKWIDATCTVPRTCSTCSFTEGNPLGHTNDNGICNRCGINNTKPLVYAGYGQDVITGVNVPYGLYRVIMTNSGKEHFSVITYDEDGNYDDLLANTSGSAFVGEALYREGEIQATTGWSFEIDSESNWTITIEPIDEQITSNIKGSGSVVTGFFSGQGLAAVAMTNSGKEHFSVIIYDNQGNYIKLLANDGGNAFSGRAAVTLKPEKQYFLVIDSESEWTINFGFEDKTTEYYDNK